MLPRSRRLLFALLIVAVAVALRFVPRPSAQVLACYLAPSPAVCDLVLTPFVGAENQAEENLGPDEPLPEVRPAAAPAPDAAPATSAPAAEDLDREPAPPAGAPVAARRRPAAPALPASVQLRVGEQALRQGWHVTAYRRCRMAAADRGELRAAALLCQGRAALGMRWPARAAYLAQRVLDLRQDPAALVLLGDAHRALNDCRQARPAYLRALELRPDDPVALAGLGRCSVDLPAPGPAPDLAGAPRRSSGRQGRRERPPGRRSTSRRRRRPAGAAAPPRRARPAAPGIPGLVRLVLAVLRDPRIRALIKSLLADALSEALRRREVGHA